jgi:myo-inositol 2-dehydrogenase / D-chiro-inositol 1-dehydrogenase
MSTSTNRRDFLAAAGATGVALGALPAVHAAGADVIKVGVIGCGGRGSGAADNCLQADKSVHIVAVADAFEERAKGLASNLGKKKQFAGRVNIDDRVFSGFDAYQQLLKQDVDLVILATPPGFRPTHLAAVVAAGKHIFCEKPVAVDGPGIRQVLALVEETKKKNLAVVAGTQRRHQLAYLEVAKRVAGGDIGEIVGGRCSWNNDGIWFRKRDEMEKQLGRKVADTEYQMRNWYHFLWLCGDHIVEQHVHNLDVTNWLIGAHPLKATGMGGRMGGTPARPNGEPKDAGHIFDHFAVEYEYPNGVHIASYCRHYPGPGDVSEMVVGTKGTVRTSDKNYYKLGDKDIYSVDQDKDDVSPYVREHQDLIASIKAGKPLNELEQVTHSTLTAIMGRMSAYTGRSVTWKQALESKETTMPKELAMNLDLPAPVLPVPGKTKFV